MPLNYILRKFKEGWKFTKSQKKIHQLTYTLSSCLQKMKKKILETLTQTKRKYRKDAGMEFGIEKYTMKVMKREKGKNRKNKTAKSEKPQNS